jgi:hypothetical protein
MDRHRYSATSIAFSSSACPPKGMPWRRASACNRRNTDFARTAPRLLNHVRASRRDGIERKLHGVGRIR